MVSCSGRLLVAEVGVCMVPVVVVKARARGRRVGVLLPQADVMLPAELWTPRGVMRLHFQDWGILEEWDCWWSGAVAALAASEQGHSFLTSPLVLLMPLF